MSVSPKFEQDEESLRANFEKVLEEAETQGIPAPDDIGLQYAVSKAICDVALAFPKGGRLVPKARIAFERQLKRT